MDKKTKILIVSFLFILLIGALCFLYFVLNLKNNPHSENRIQKNTKEEIQEINNNTNQKQEIENETQSSTTTEDKTESQKNIQEPVMKDDKYYYFSATLNYFN